MRTSIRLLAAASGVAVVAGAWTMGVSAGSPKIFRDDPVWVERDTEDASTMKRQEVDLVVDLTYNMVAGRRAVTEVRAKNLNTVDEVPDSNWFTNRVGHRALTAT